MKAEYVFPILAIVVLMGLLAKLLLDRNYDGSIGISILIVFFITILVFMIYDSRKQEAIRQKDREFLMSGKPRQEKVKTPYKFVEFATKEDVRELSQKVAFLEGYLFGLKHPLYEEEK